MNRPTVTLRAGEQRVAGIATALDQPGGPLLVALHGGGYTSRYFDVPGHSLLDTAAANGLDVVALDRPGYGDSDSPARVTFAANAEVLDAAIGQLWAEHGAGRPGVVVIAHSIGAAIAIHLAAGEPAWPLLGVAISGIHDRAPEHVRSAWDAMPAGQPVVFEPAQRRRFFYGPDWTIEPDVVDRAEISAAPIPLEELLEVVRGWTEEAATLAARVRVPVHYVAFEFEGLWTIDRDTVAAFAAAFGAAPVVEARLIDRKSVV